jgi:hypothetical protein
MLAGKGTFLDLRFGLGDRFSHFFGDQGGKTAFFLSKALGQFEKKERSLREGALSPRLKGLPGVFQPGDRVFPGKLRIDYFRLFRGGIESLIGHKSLKGTPPLEDVSIRPDWQSQIRAKVRGRILSPPDNPHWLNNSFACSS